MRTWTTGPLVAAWVALLLFGGCALPLSNHNRADGRPGPLGSGEPSAESHYAGEVLAYMMRVVLGRAGDLERRNDWRRRGLGRPLDLDWVAATMAHPQRSKSEVMVVDASLIGLSEVLYDYDPRLNLFKGEFAFHSPYPSAELIALRLLLLGKLHRGETLTFSAIVRNETALIAQGAALSAARLEEMGLSVDEAALLQAVFRSEPAFRWYYKSPPLVAAMDAMGLLSPEAPVARRVARHDYGPWGKGPPTASKAKVRVAVLPSLVPGFRAAPGGGLSPPENYSKAIAAFKTALESAVAARLGGRAAAAARLEVQLFQERPFVIHPLNAERHLARLCPGADLAVIVLGRNVYRAIDFDPPEAAAPQPPLWYLDILDLKYGQTAAEIDAIADAVVRRMAGPSPTS
jgi:hypothetical protein